MADTEEKKHPPTATKLRRMRREGQVAHSRDLVTLAVVPILLWLAFGWSSFERGLRRLMAELFSVGFNIDAEVITRNIMPGFIQSAVWLALPILILAALLIILVSILDTGGPVFSAKPLTPRFDRLNPGEGLKRIFSARTGAESALSLIKLGVFTLMAVTLIWGSLDTVRNVQACGMRCLPALMTSLILPLVIFSCALYLVAAIIDFVMSRALFRLEMRMSDTELKRENKDTYGNPEVRRTRRDQGRQMLGGAARLGPRSATVVILGRSEAIGLRFVQGETGAPVVVAKGRGAAAEELLAVARAASIPVVNRPTLATVLDQRGVVGQFVPTETFTDVAAAIIAAGG